MTLSEIVSQIADYIIDNRTWIAEEVDPGYKQSIMDEFRDELQNEYVRHKCPKHNCMCKWVYRKRDPDCQKCDAPEHESLQLIDTDKLLDLIDEQMVKESGPYTKGVNYGLNIAKRIICNERV